MALSTTATANVGTQPSPRRDPVAFLLFYKMTWCERHPGVMLACLAALAVAGSLLEKVLP